MPSFLDARALADTSKFYFAIIADTHIIDEFYKGPESNPEDTESMFKTRERLISARDTINALQPAMEQVFQAPSKRAQLIRISSADLA